MALLADGTVVVWGDNTYGQTNVPAGLSNVVAIAAGFYHCLALRNDGTVTAWGNNTYGQTNVPAGLANVVGHCRRRLPKPGPDPGRSIRNVGAAFQCPLYRWCVLPPGANCLWPHLLFAAQRFTRRSLVDAFPARPGQWRRPDPGRSRRPRPPTLLSRLAKTLKGFFFAARLSQ